MIRWSSSLGIVATLAASACLTEDEGTVTVTAYGESFVEDGIPASEVGDGWAIDFARFDMEIADVVVAGSVVDMPAGPFDLCVPSMGAGHELGSIAVSAGEHTDASFLINCVDVEGVATKGNDVKTFHWAFEQRTQYSECETTTSVSDGDEANFQITVHADHLFYDSLVAETPQILFQALADADLDGDGSITPGELAMKDIGAYDPGSDDGIDDLWAWLSAQVRTLGHVDGEGHCRATAVD